jgi:formate dehydrogenase major subunit
LGGLHSLIIPGRDNPKPRIGLLLKWFLKFLFYPFLVMAFKFFSKWPLIQQLRTGSDGTGPEAMSQRTQMLGPRSAGASVSRSICPYCGVGCGQLIFHKDNKLVAIEGDPESPISRGRLCPKGADSHELLTHSRREIKVKYRRPYGTEWEELNLETAMDMIAERVWQARDATFVEKQDGQVLMQTKAIGHLGGATLDNEENYLIKKLFTGGLGMVCVSNQARI